MSENIRLDPSLSRTWKITSDLRWYCSKVGEITTRPVLQQAWFCIETGEVVWKDIPVETHE